MSIDIDLLKLQDNPMVRIPVSIICDTSSSMNLENRITELNKGIKQIIKDIKSDEMLSLSVEMSIIGFKFNNKSRTTEVEEVVRFESMEDVTIPKLIAFGKTPLGEAVNLGIEKLEERKNLYKQAGIQYYQPIMVILTDGDPTDCIKKASRKTKELIRENKLSVYPVGIGQDVSLKKLQEFVYKPLAKRVSVKDITKLFDWLTSSVEKVSNSGFNLDSEEVEVDWSDL